MVGGIVKTKHPSGGPTCKRRRKKKKKRKKKRKERIEHTHTHTPQYLFEVAHLPLGILIIHSKEIENTYI